jgi:hypothetical protein
VLEQLELDDLEERVGRSDAPCLCGPTGADAIPWISHMSRDNPIVDEEIADLTMLHTSCGVSSCNPNLFQRALGWWLAVASIMFQNGHAITRVGTMLGAVTVGLGAAVSGGIVTAGAAGGGLLAGVAAGAPAALVGLLVGAILGGIIGGLLGAFVKWIGGLFSSDENADSGKLNLLFPTDNAHTWGNKASFQRSRGQPSLAFREAESGIAWTGNDGRPNTIVAAAGGAHKRTYNEQSNTSGSGLAAFGPGYLLAWRGRCRVPGRPGRPGRPSRGGTKAKSSTWRGSIRATRSTLLTRPMGSHPSPGRASFGVRSVATTPARDLHSP